MKGGLQTFFDMSKPIIETFELGKKYKIESSHHRFFSSGQDDFWALQNLNIQIEKGQFVGLLGRNGSGKSTLLKLLSEITAPSVGQFTLRGKVSSVLEVGIGFHHELSGRENIYLNGSLLGMRKKEIDMRVDEIVSFSETELFLDTPIKRFSSGMVVRLAFAIASYLRTDILILDEVLAVGDYKFREQALKRMQEMSNNGSTILLVSHDLPALLKVCDTGILLEEGKLKATGSFEEVARNYEKDSPAI